MPHLIEQEEDYKKDELTVLQKKNCSQNTNALRNPNGNFNSLKSSLQIILDNVMEETIEDNITIKLQQKMNA